MRLRPGTVAPTFATTDFLGTPVDLAALRGRPVMLSFYRYAACPLCNLRVHELIGAHDRLGEMGLAMVAVFQSPAERIAEQVGRQDAPFPIVADPSMALYRDYGAETRWGGLASAAVARSGLAAMRSGFRPGRTDGPVQRVPADFLIDRDGSIAVAHYGRDIGDHLPIDEIEAWLRSTEQADRRG